jgi:hypothetical protein
LPISYQFAGKTIWVTLAGQYSFAEIEQAAARILNDPAFTDDMNLLLDARLVTVNPTLAEVRARAMFLNSVARNRPGKIVLVVADTLRYGLGRMLSIYAQMEGVKVEVFMDIEQARQRLEPD